MFDFCVMGNTVHRKRSVHLVLLIELLLALTLHRLGANLLVVLLQGRKVLTGLRELTLLHALTDVPVHERTLGVHQIELVVQAREHLSDSRGVRDHAHRRCTLARSPPGTTVGGW